MRLTIAVLLAHSAAYAAPVPTPPRSVTVPTSLVSLANPQARPVPIADLTFTRRLGSTAWSADAKQLFLATNLSGRMNIWRMEAVGGWPVQMVQSDDAQSGLEASPDDALLFYQQDAGGGEYYDLYAVPTAGGAPVRLTDTPDLSETGVVATDGAIAFAVRRKGEGQENVGVMDLATHTIRPLTAESDPQYRWAPVAWVDAGRALIANRSDAGDTTSEVWRIEIATAKATLLIGKKGVIYEASDATKDGAHIAITSNEGGSQLHAGRFDSAAGKTAWLKPTPWEQRSADIAPDGRAMLVSTNIDGSSALILVDLGTLIERAVPLPPGFNRPAPGHAFAPDGSRLLVAHSAGNAPTELDEVTLATGATRPLLRLAMASLDPAILPPSQVVTFKSYDGTLVSAVVTMPFNLKRDGANPAIVLPHGGPTGQTLASFSTDAAALASRGYITIAPNPRGSTGYGKPFQTANFKDLGGGDLKDEIAAKQFLVASGYVDAKKVGITGGSYGGFMTLMAIGRTPDEFAAAVQQYGIINWRTMWQHEDASLQTYQRTLLGSPEDNPKVYDASSPLTYIGNAKAPLLSLQGENDIRVPRGQAQEVTDLLKAKGNIVEAKFYPAEGHGFQKRENMTDATTRMVAWFDKYLKGEGQ